MCMDRQTLIFTVANFCLNKNNTLFSILAENPNEIKRAIATGGRLTEILLHALCVFLCTPLFDC